MSIGTTVRPELPKMAWPSELAQIMGVALAEAIALKYGNAYGIEPLLKFYVQKGSSADKHTHVGTECLAHGLEHLFIKEIDNGLFPEMLYPRLARVMVFACNNSCEFYAPIK